MNTIKVIREGDNIRLLIDDAVIEQIFDPIEFVLALIVDRPVIHEFFTCSCGVSGCAGWFEGFRVGVNTSAEEWQVWWECLDEGKLDVVKEFYIFDYSQYWDTQQECKILLYELAAERAARPRTPQYDHEDNYDYEILTYASPEAVTAEIASRSEWILKHR